MTILEDFEDLKLCAKYVSPGNVHIAYLKELYEIMSKHGINRIYHVNNKGKFSEAHQSQSVFMIRDSMILTKIIQLIKKYFPIIYFKIILNYRLHRYRIKLKRLIRKYNVESINSGSFSLYEGISIKENEICVNNVQVVFKSGVVHHIDKLYVEI